MQVAVLVGCTDFGLEAPEQFCSKAIKKQWKTMVVDEVTRVEEVRFSIKVIVQPGRDGRSLCRDASARQTYGGHCSAD